VSIKRNQFDLSSRGLKDRIGFANAYRNCAKAHKTLIERALSY